MDDTAPTNTSIESQPASTDSAASHPAEAQASAAPPPAADPAPALSAADQLRALEDHHLGPDAPRVDGKIEDGHGSMFSRLPLVHQLHMLALRALADVEAEFAKAEAELKAIKDRVEAAAEKVVEAAKKAL